MRNCERNSHPFGVIITSATVRVLKSGRLFLSVTHQFCPTVMFFFSFFNFSGNARSFGFVYFSVALAQRKEDRKADIASQFTCSEWSACSRWAKSYPLLRSSPGADSALLQPPADVAGPVQSALAHPAPDPHGRSARRLPFARAWSRPSSAAGAQANSIRAAMNARPIPNGARNRDNSVSCSGMR